jgi:hypothetical protein
MQKEEIATSKVTLIGIIIMMIGLQLSDDIKN